LVGIACKWLGGGRVLRFELRIHRDIGEGSSQADLGEKPRLYDIELQSHDLRTRSLSSWREIMPLSSFLRRPTDREEAAIAPPVEILHGRIRSDPVQFLRLLRNMPSGQMGVISEIPPTGPTQLSHPELTLSTTTIIAMPRASDPNGPRDEFPNVSLGTRDLPVIEHSSSPSTLALALKA